MKGRQFRDVFATLKQKAVPWGTLSATCHVAYEARDRNPLCQCKVTVKAAVEDVMAAIWAIDSEPMRYSKDVRYTVHGPRPPTARSVHWDFHFRPPLGMGEITCHVQGVWQQLRVTPDPQGELARTFEIVWLPRSEGLTQAEINHRASIHGFILLENICEGITRLEYTYQVDLASHFATIRRLVRNVDMFSVLHHRASLKSIMLYFQQRLPLAALDDDDARRLADALFAIRSGQSMLLPAVTERVARRMDQYRALQELVTLYPSLPTLFAAVLRKKLRRPAPVTAHLSELTTDEAARIGDGLGMLIMTSPSAQVAVHEWLLQSEALREMQEQQPSFVPMVKRMAELLVTLVSQGVKLRVLICALLSYLDVLSDAVVIRQYFAAGEVTAAQASLGFLGANMVLQIAVCISQNFRNPEAMALEIVYSLIFLKPILEVLRIVRGEQQKPYHTVSLIVENTYAKAAEVFAEAGPAAFLQVYLLLLVAHPTYFQYLSIVISIATAAFTIASIDFNLDTDPKLRLVEPRFYGFVPDRSSERAKIFAVMFLNSFAQMAALAIGTASLAHMDPNMAMGAWYGRWAMMYTVKLARRDLSYYLPIRGLPGVIVAVFIDRPATMFLGDVGLWVYGRHTNEMGCVLWWFGRLWPWLLLTAAIVLRATAPAQLAYMALNTTTAMAEVLDANASTIPAANTAAILNTSSSLVAANGTLNETGDYTQSVLRDPIVLSAVAAVLFAVWLLSLVTFFLLAKPEYWPSFWSNETAAEYTKRVKWDGQPDERLRAMLLVRVHPSLLRLIAPEARIWIDQNWKRWTKHKPGWFTDRWKRGLPDTVLPQHVRKQLGGKNRRRSTLSEQLGVGADLKPPTAVVATASASAAAAAASAGSNVPAAENRRRSTLSEQLGVADDLKPQNDVVAPASAPPLPQARMPQLLNDSESDSEE